MRRAAAVEGVEVCIREYFRIGLPITALTLAFGTVWLLMSS
jgi:Na+/H+ antiporter NhaD/arsenite permease-like protein